MAKVGFTTKDGKVVTFTTKKRATRANETTALATRANSKHIAVPQSWIDTVMDVWAKAPVASEFVPEHSWSEPPHSDTKVRLSLTGLPADRRDGRSRHQITVRVFAGRRVPAHSAFGGMRWVGGMWSRPTPEEPKCVLSLPKGDSPTHMENVVAHELVHAMQHFAGLNSRFGERKQTAAEWDAQYAARFSGGGRGVSAGYGSPSSEFEAYVTMSVNDLGKKIARVYDSLAARGATDPNMAEMYNNEAMRRRFFHAAFKASMDQYINDDFGSPELKRRFVKKFGDAAAAIYEKAERSLAEQKKTVTRANRRKPAKRATVARGKDKATFKFYVIFRGPPNGVNIHAGFATQQAARAFITKKFKGTRRLQVRGRPSLVKSGHNPKVASNWKTFSLAASLKALPAPRKRTTVRKGRR
jgi:hypothetical protein